MRFAFFYHSLVSDWNHGNAHFLRGVVTELLAQGHRVTVYEPETGWSRTQMMREPRGPEALEGMKIAYPGLESITYGADFDPFAHLEGVDVVVVHEWTEPAVVAQLVDFRGRSPGSVLLFHDTHHRAVSAPDQLERFPFSGFDGVLVFGRTLEEVYRRRGWHDKIWVWHEAADTRVFRPLPGAEVEGDLVWIGNWGDEERSHELRHYLLEPCRRLNLKALVHGVRYPPEAVRELERSGIEYGGWLPNHEVPSVFSRFRATVHIPRRSYVRDLPGIPTIRVFEALACGIPLVCSPWEDREGLFRPGMDYLPAANPTQMESHLHDLLHDEELASALRESGLERIREGHTCAHRVEELLDVVAQLAPRRVPA